MPTRFNGPLLQNDNSRGSREHLAHLPLSSEDGYISYFNDFLVAADYAAANWVITTTEDGTGSATEALAADEIGGALLLTNADADNDLDSLQATEETWALGDEKRLWFSCRAKVAGAATVDAFIGLAITDTTTLVTSDRVGFQISAGDASILCISEKDATETQTDSGADAVDDTYVTLSMYWDGKSKVKFAVDNAVVATHTTNNPDDENLAITLHVQNGAAAVNTMTIDYIKVVQER